MDTENRDHSTRDDQPRKRGVLPCGSRVCLRCHKNCGAMMSSYLGGFDEPTANTEEKAD